MERNKEAQNAVLVDLQNEMKSLKSLLVSRRATSNIVDQVSSAPITPPATASTPTPAVNTATPATVASPTDGLSSRLSATINGSNARAGIPAWQMAAAQASANNTSSSNATPEPATAEASGSSSAAK